MPDDLTDDEKRIVIRWIVKIVNARTVPPYDGDDEGLVYNLVKLAQHGWESDAWDLWRSTPEMRSTPRMDEEVCSWRSRLDAGEDPLAL